MKRLPNSDHGAYQSECGDHGRKRGTAFQSTSEGTLVRRLQCQTCPLTQPKIVLFAYLAHDFGNWLILHLGAVIHGGET